MTYDGDAAATHGVWRCLYCALLRLLPGVLRDKQGDAMVDLYARELLRRSDDGTVAVWRAGFAGLMDLLRRGLYERLSEERRELRVHGFGVIRNTVSAFLVAFTALTMLMVSKVALTRATAFAGGTAFDVVLFSIPFTAALTIPMAVFVAVLWAATHESSVGAARRSESNVNRDRGPLRLVPVVSMASVVALCCVALNAELVPRANLRLQALYSGGAVVSPTDRSMTLEELLRAESWQAARADGVASTRTSGSSDANYGVEIHKKFALAAACVMLALFAAGIARRAPHVGVLSQGAISLTVFTTYYVCLIAGEQLADRAVVPPAVAMWSANFIVLGFAVLTLRAARMRRALPAMVSRLRG